MSIARSTPPKCPTHTDTDMVLAEEVKSKQHDDDSQGIAWWYCPLCNNLAAGTGSNYAMQERRDG